MLPTAFKELLIRLQRLLVMLDAPLKLQPRLTRLDIELAIEVFAIMLVTRVNIAVGLPVMTEVALMACGIMAIFIVICAVMVDVADN